MAKVSQSGRHQKLPAIRPERPPGKPQIVFAGQHGATRQFSRMATTSSVAQPSDVIVAGRCGKTSPGSRKVTAPDIAANAVQQCKLFWPETWKSPRTVMRICLLQQTGKERTRLAIVEGFCLQGQEGGHGLGVCLRQPFRAYKISVGHRPAPACRRDQRTARPPVHARSSSSPSP